MIGMRANGQKTRAKTDTRISCHVSAKMQPKEVVESLEGVRRTGCQRKGGATVLKFQVGVGGEMGQEY